MFAAAKKANGFMGVIRTFTHLDLKGFSLIYESLVRSQLGILKHGVCVVSL